MTDAKPLNRALHRRLVATFKEVQIRNAGEKVRSTKSLDPKKGEFVRKLKGGERYAVCCPFCDDTRFRMSVPYVYGQLNEDGRVNKRLAMCFNAGCKLNEGDPETLDKLYDMLTGRSLVDLSKAAVSMSYSSEGVSLNDELPDGFQPLNKLPSQHEAIQYLKHDRNFDLRVLHRRFKVGFCDQSTVFPAKQKIIIPVFYQSKLVGWQARPPFDSKDWKKERSPKYYTARGFAKSNFLYNADALRTAPFGVFMEGVTDVWRLPDHGVCCFGMPSDRQLALFAKLLGKKPGVLLLDGDIHDSSRPDYEKKKEFYASVTASLSALLRRRLVTVTLPPDADPGSRSMTTDILLGLIGEQAMESGIKL